MTRHFGNFLERRVLESIAVGKNVTPFTPLRALNDSQEQLIHHVKDRFETAFAATITGEPIQKTGNVQSISFVTSGEGNDLMEKD